MIQPSDISHQTSAIRPQTSDFYPKRGPLQQLDIPDVELKKLVNIFTVEARAREVVIHDINNHLREIVKSEGSSSLLLIKENQENPSSAVLALRASVVAHGFVPVNKFPHKS
ncbi:MAG: hypothetical protein IKM95_04185 [Bacteroidales bacterium]|nr:hypothetical protein [Bacteroidales bacterium]